MSSLLHDLRYALRALRKSPGFTAVAVLTLALGIGANTAIFSVVNGVLLRPAPFAQMNRLAMVWETDRHSGTAHEPASVPDYLDFTQRTTQFSRLAAFEGDEVNFAPSAGAPVRLAAMDVTGDFLPLVGIQPLMGRGFTAAESAVGGPNVALIGEGLWRERFAGDPNVVGQTIRLDGVPRTVVGVVPADADFGVFQILKTADYGRAFADRGEKANVQVWLPLRPDPKTSPRDTHPIFVLGRLAPGATPATGQQEMARIAADLEATYPVNAARGVHVESLGDVVFGPVRPALYILLGAVGLVLLVACVNVANLLLARGTTRVRDVAVRSALGAGRRRMVRQFLVEGIVLAIVGGVVGVGLAFWGTRALLAIAPADIPRVASVGVDFRVLVATLAIAVLVGVVFGIVPAVQAGRVDVQSALRVEGAGRLVGGGRAGRLRSTLVIGQLALAVTLVAGAGLLIRSFWRLQGVDTGFHTAGVLKAEFQLPPSRYPADFSQWPDFKAMHLFNAQLLGRVAALPGVRAAALAGNGPLDAGFTNSFVVVGREAEAKDWPEISVRRVTPGYFGTVGLAVERGRPLEASDGTHAAPVALVNEAAARRFFAGRNPIGAQIRFWGANRTVVGIAANERFRGMANAAPPAVYLPLAQAPSADGAETLLLKVDGKPGAFATAARRAIRSVDPALAPFGVEPLQQTLERSVGSRRFTMVLLGLFAALAVTLAAIGIHGVLSFTVAQRTREMGIRLALGARSREVLQMVLGRSLALAGAGLLLGGIGAFAVGRVLRSQLYGISPTDPVTIVAVVVFLALVALAASTIPALRATRIDPVEALRHE
ncbi:MAG TPA: ABC transporter permease [Gemmatimonadales bacterium]|nr:ABC transporter permease [Gemmatimonadales bacterium]